MQTTTTTCAAVLVAVLCSVLNVQAAPDGALTPPPQSPVVTAPAVTAPAPPVKPAAAPVAVPVIPATPAAPAQPVAPAPAAAAAKSDKAAASPVSVLERFRTYAGPRTPAAMSGLFNGPIAPGVSQQPEVVLSSGAAVIRITAKLPAASATAPGFAGNGAQMMSYEQVRKNEWMIDALPEAGVLKAGLMILSGGTAFEIPLTVAPPLSADIDLSENAFITFLKGKETPQKALLDLNGDGRRDYIDDFIFTANYLVNKNNPKVTEEPKAARKNDEQAPSQSADRAPDTSSKPAEQQKSDAGQGTPQFSGGGWAGPSSALPTDSGQSAVDNAAAAAKAAADAKAAAEAKAIADAIEAVNAKAAAEAKAKAEAEAAAKARCDAQGNKTEMNCCGYILTYNGCGPPSSVNRRNCQARCAGVKK